ncbi:MAG TPA: branched-chain amino acid ABC transporter substrate-binding protein [Solirubrobacteraceae bacterium]|nr:branched-chain amino acid ABC transporter substrate-binding protein [Solirubrobacteraceae bacterium]
MRPPRRRGGRAALLGAAVALIAAGCGSGATVEGGNNAFSATTLTVYTCLPLLGPDSADMTSMVDGEELALYRANGYVRRLHVSIDELDDYADVAVASSLRTNTVLTGNCAHTASSDLSTAAYIGDFDSVSTALSLPLNNQNGILQISPGASYPGFTDAGPANVGGDPRNFYGNRVRTFARLVPSDTVQAQAIARFMRSEGVRRLAVLRDSSPAFGTAIAPLLATAARAAGITVVARRNGIDTDSATSPKAFASLAGSLARARPDAVFAGAAPQPGTQLLFKALHEALPEAKLFAPSELAVPTFLDGLAAGPASSTYLTSPYLEPSQYPPAARSVLAGVARLFTGQKPTVYALYGYEAMSDVLSAIRHAKNPAQRGGGAGGLVSSFFHLGVIHGVIGTYTINSSGDSSLRTFDGYRIGSGGALQLVRAFS